MSLRLLVSLATLSFATAASLPAAPVRAIAFGDSITSGSYDCNNCGGYPKRLDSRLVAAGWNLDIINSGEGGERTNAGLSRIDGVLDSYPSADFLLLMEGTNDVYANNISAETTQYNLDQMAIKAETRGLTAIQATLVPNPKWAQKDPDNIETEEFNDLIRATAIANGRSLVDTFDYFLSFITTNAKYKDYYYCVADPSGPNGCQIEPVGHPKDTGYDKLTDPFEDALLALLPAGASIRLPSAPFSGNVLTFKAFLYYPDITSVEWDFGDGGHATVAPGSDGTPAADWIYLEPGTYTVTLRWTRSGGQTGELTKTITVGGTAPAWSTRVSLVPLALRGAGPAPDDLRFDLDLANANATARIAEIELLGPADPDLLPLLALPLAPPDGGWNEAVAIAALRETVPPPSPSPRRWLVPGGGSLALADLLGDGFDSPSGQAAARITAYFQSGSAANSSATGELYRAASPAAGATVAEREAGDWSGDARQLANLAPSGTVEVSLALTNLGDRDTLLALTLFDGGDGVVTVAPVPVLRRSTLTATLATLFPSSIGATGPFRVEIGASAVPFEAVAVAVDSATGDVVETTATP
jgi:lysophospholipase L1-like esterase